MKIDYMGKIMIKCNKEQLIILFNKIITIFECTAQQYIRVHHNQICTFQILLSSVQRIHFGIQ